MYRVLEVSWERENYDPIKARDSYSVLPAAYLYLPLNHLFTSISQTVANGSNSDSSHLWPAYFVERPNGIFNAPVEGNHLPELIRVRRLPSKLSAADTAGMASVGIKKEGQKKYNIEIADILGKFHFAEPFKHTARKNASITSTTIPSSKALVSWSRVEAVW